MQETFFASTFAYEARSLKTVVRLYQKIRDTLSVGLVPTEALWGELQLLSSPWSQLSTGVLNQLRQEGASLMPTLRRLEQLAIEQGQILEKLHAISSHAHAQAMICLCLVPLAGGGLYVCLEELRSYSLAWICICLFAFCLDLLAVRWLMSLALRCRWAGLKSAHKLFLLGSFATLEAFIAFLRCGHTHDKAWQEALTLLEQYEPHLARAWGLSIWMVGGEALEEEPSVVKTAERVFYEVGQATRQAVHASLLQGRPCLDRIEQILLDLRAQVDALIQKETQLLSIRCLKPLFVFVVPSILMITGSAVGILLYAAQYF